MYKNKPSGQNFKPNGHATFQKNKYTSPADGAQHGKKRKREEKDVHPYNSQTTNGVKIKREAPKVNGYHKSAAQAAKGGPQSTVKNTPMSERSRALIKARSQLPIWPHISEIRRGLTDGRNVMILVGETGSGKSTQVPQFLTGESWCGDGCIAITQPRRVAAISLAKRVAEEVGTPLGKSSPASKVGYSVRFENNAAKGTKIKYLTDGMLVQEMLRDPWLKEYSAVIVDEVHERGVNVDLILGFLKRIVTGGKEVKKRRGDKDLKVVIMSATADVEKLFRFFEEGFSGSKEEVPLTNGPTNGAQDEDAISESSWSGLSSTEDNATESKTKPVDLIAEGGVKEVYSSHISTVNVEGRQFPVEVMYLPEATTDFVEAALKTIFQIHYKEPLPGDILVFLTGQDTVDTLVTLVNESAAAMGPEVPKILTLPLFAALPQEEQQLVFAPAPPKTRKIIIATNIAETSLTIPGIRHVIDSGLAKIKEYRPTLSLDSLLIKPISQSSAIQRKGRAGRESSGKCYRLYTESDYLKLSPTTVPEILRCDLATALLTMKARGVSDVLSFPFLDPPTPDSTRKALLSLHRLGALSPTGAITPTGKTMARLPLSPQLARVLVAAATPTRDCVLDAIDIVSCLTVENIFLPLTSEEVKEDADAARKDIFRREGDHLTLMATLQAYARENTDRKAWAVRHAVSHRALATVLKARRQLRIQCQALGLLPRTFDVTSEDPNPQNQSSSSAEKSETLLRTLLSGFATNVARLCPDGSYKTVEGNQTVGIHPGSVLYGKKVEAVLYNELVWTTRCWARGVSAVRMDWWGDAVEEGAGEGGAG